MNKPCSDCPFRKNSIKGWLGTAKTPEEFLSISDQHPIPCHLQVKEEEWQNERLINALGWSNTCIGSLQFMKNTCKLPFDRKYVAILNNSERNLEIFETRKDFIKHHNS